MPSFKDHFSNHATLYRDARPLPPADWFAWLAGQAPDLALAWDAGCGNGQASIGLAAHFDRVVATDPSMTQITQAIAHPAIDYRVEPAERSSLAEASASLVCVSQALHWFDLDAFHAEVRRVARPRALLAVSAYGNCSVDRVVDAVERTLYADTLGGDWPSERALVDSGYRELPFPFEPVPTPSFAMHARWNLAQFVAYLRSWSATQRYMKRTGADPVQAAMPLLAAAWGDPDQARTVRWPFFTRVGRIA
ncbi:class I SAM-dependent methyltransferase [Frateuria terrea]|uniref:Methyltransferase domain-containing protein n=1 Tax=Frateuria terrea TaxID=529704 RepID=A0A1H6X2D6_9GAMM|nr:class I SAM-dependent methyltransferase [Frateuria terrea]SEJ23333.1 Methyltransferase domain-containing protein [Frateuria terrea]SFP59058.1 Methyltransferase domain-containing protein [Frateuria terrea]